MLESLTTVCVRSAEVVDTNFTEPTDWNAMLKASDVEKWLAAVKLEFDTSVKMGCWEVVDIPIDAPLLGVRWVYKIKRIQSVYERHKARLVVKGYMQEKGFSSFRLCCQMMRWCTWMQSLGSLCQRASA